MPTAAILIVTTDGMTDTHLARYMTEIGKPRMIESVDSKLTYRLYGEKG